MDEVSPEDAPDDGCLRVTRDESSSVQAGAGGFSTGLREGLAFFSHKDGYLWSFKKALT